MQLTPKDLRLWAAPAAGIAMIVLGLTRDEVGLISLGAGFIGIPALGAINGKYSASSAQDDTFQADESALEQTDEGDDYA